MKGWALVLVACMAVCACAGYSRVMSHGGGGGGGGAGRVFRPGVRAWSAAPPAQRYVQAASNRAPYVLYKNPHSRYVKPHFSSKFGGYVAGPWRASLRVPPATPAAPGPAAGAPAYEYIRAASSAARPLRVHGDRGPIYTIPAPNLSLSERPIVVADAAAELAKSTAGTATNKTKMYEVTEKTVDPLNLGVGSKYVAPVASVPQGFTFSKSPSLASPELLQLVRNSAQQFQLADTYPLPLLQQPQLLHHPALGHQLSLQGFNALIQPGAGMDPNLLQQNILFKPDPSYIHKLSNQLYQRFPGAEFFQYPVEAENPAQIYIVAEEAKNDGTEHVNVVRAADEGTVLSIVPEVVSVVANDTSITQNMTTTTEPTTTSVTTSNATQPEATTIKLEITTQYDKANPVFYPQVAESVGSIIANGFYSALTDVRAAEALASLDKSELEAPAVNQTEVPSVTADLQPFFVQNEIKEEENKTAETIQPLHGSPFTKAEPIGDVAYSFLRREGDTKTDITKDGARYAGQIVEASISDDDEFNHEKAALRRRAPLRLYSQSHHESSEKPRKSDLKAKPKPTRSKLAYDEKTGEPVIRIYANSYQSSSKSSEEREIVTKKYNRNESNRGNHRVRSSTPGVYDEWKSSSVKSLDRIPSGSDVNQVTQFGLKLRPRMDDYPLIFEDEEE